MYFHPVSAYTNFIENKFESQKEKAGFTLTLLISFFFSVGISVDIFTYIKEGFDFLVLINSLLIVELLISQFILLYYRKSWSVIIIINYSFIVINLILSSIHHVLTLENPEIDIFRINLIGFIIVVTSAFILSRYWTIIYTLCVSLTFILTAVYSENEILLDDIFILPMIHIGTAFAVIIFIQMYNRTEKRAHQSELEVIKLRALMDREKSKITQSINILIEKNDDTNIDLSRDLTRLLKMVNYNLSDVVFEYSQNVTSDENLFFNRLLKTHPNLTSGELKLCYMLVKNKSSKEIAGATSCTTNSVKVFRSRLRKKIGLQQQTNLVSYLKAIEIKED